ncbi:MAG: tryptophan--tRNA ligase [Candidatus Woesearchaeota archaeon]
MKVNISKEVKEKYPDLDVKINIIKNVDTDTVTDELKDHIKKFCVDYGQQTSLEEIKKSKEIKAYREFYKKLDADPTKRIPPVERESELCFQNKVPLPNPIVSCFIMATVETGCIVGAFDADKIKGDYNIRFARKGEKLKRLDNREFELSAKEIVFEDQEKIVSAYTIGDTYKTKITPETKNVMVLAVNAPGITKKNVQTAVEKATEYVEIFCRLKGKPRIIDPWGSILVKDYTKLIKDFGLEEFNPKLFPNPNRIMRRGVVFAGRDLAQIAKAIKEKKPFYALSGIVPSGDKIHLGNKMVVENLRYFQELGAKTYILVADLEAAAARGVSVEDARRRALDFHIPAYVALGLDPKKTVFYFQSENIKVVNLASEFSKRVTENEFRAIYGHVDPGKLFSAIVQVGDILYPQLKERMPGIIPVGIDQDPHIRLTRDLVRRSKEGYFLPSGIYHKYTPSLDGAIKMSKSKPESCIELPEETNAVCKKLKRALTGGRDTVEEQRKNGGQPENCMIFELYKQHLVEDDKELEDIYTRCKSGELLCGECKQLACEKMTQFMDSFVKEVDKARKNLKNLNFVRFGKDF